MLFANVYWFSIYINWSKFISQGWEFLSRFVHKILFFISLIEHKIAKPIKKKMNKKKCCDLCVISYHTKIPLATLANRWSFSLKVNKCSNVFIYRCFVNSIYLTIKKTEIIFDFNHTSLRLMLSKKKRRILWEPYQSTHVRSAGAHMRAHIHAHKNIVSLIYGLGMNTVSELIWPSGKRRSLCVFVCVLSLSISFSPSQESKESKWR